jgi:hypothetical protein
MLRVGQIRFANQKNGQKGESRTQGTDQWHREFAPSAVWPLPNLITNLLTSCTPHSHDHTPLCYRHCQWCCNIAQVHSHHRQQPAATPLSSRLNSPWGPHCLRLPQATTLGGVCYASGSAMALFLSGHPRPTSCCLDAGVSTGLPLVFRLQILEWTSSLSQNASHSQLLWRWAPPSMPQTNPCPIALPWSPSHDPRLHMQNGIQWYCRYWKRFNGVSWKGYYGSQKGVKKREARAVKPQQNVQNLVKQFNQ